MKNEPLNEFVDILDRVQTEQRNSLLNHKAQDWTKYVLGLYGLDVSWSCQEDGLNRLPVSPLNRNTGSGSSQAGTGHWQGCQNGDTPSMPLNDMFGTTT